jgi:hypothetical protein
MPWGSGLRFGVAASTCYATRANFDMRMVTGAAKAVASAPARWYQGEMCVSACMCVCVYILCVC